jgi:signal peptidase
MKRNRRLLILLAAALLVCMISPVTRVGALFGYHFYNVLTDSMRPALWPDDLIVVKAVPAAEIQVGDIVTYKLFRIRTLLNTHRVVEVRKDSFVTKGDALPEPDRPVPKANVVGKVVWQLRGMGPFYALLRKFPFVWMD